MPNIPRQQGHVVNHLRPWPNWPPQHCHWCHLGSNGGSWESLGGWIIARQRFNLGWQNGRAQLHHMVAKWFAWNMEADHFFRKRATLRTQIPTPAAVGKPPEISRCLEKKGAFRVPWMWWKIGSGGRSSQHWFLIRMVKKNMFLPKWECTSKVCFSLFRTQHGGYCLLSYPWCFEHLGGRNMFCYG